MMAAANPAITSVRTHRLQMGRMAMTMLNEALTKSEIPATTTDLGFEIMIRASTLRQPLA
jgi:LacI family gluconate utilization system Gnt-I transcriptional repressor